MAGGCLTKKGGGHARNVESLVLVIGVCVFGDERALVLAEQPLKGNDSLAGEPGRVNREAHLGLAG